MPEIVDLSLPLEDDRGFSPWWARTRVKYQDHRFGSRAIRLLFGVAPSLLATGTGWANENLRLSTHGTTHVDAPWHYGPRCANQPSRTIDQMPLDWFYGTGVVVDVSDLPPNASVDVRRVQDQLASIDHQLRPHDIVLFRTGNDRLWKTRDYYSAGPGVSAEATRWLIEQGVRLMGIDSWGWDAPLRHQAAVARQSQRNDVFWAAHFVGTEREYCHMERLANLQALPPKGFTVCAFPLKVKGGSAGPARVVAIVND